MLVLTVAVSGLVMGGDKPATAVGGPATSQFDPGSLITDAVMYDSGAMSVAQVANFLLAMQPTCSVGVTCLRQQLVDVPRLPANPMCGPVSPATAQSIAGLIAQVASACSINPRVLLVLLQKEQTLVTGRHALAGETVDSVYRKATGLGCPDTAACDPAKYGLFNQIYGAAYWLLRYTMPPGTGPGTAYSSSYTWFPIGKPVSILFNPNPACGSSPVTIRNKATASLYYYTPYQPDNAALEAGWGTGSNCSSYGNRNFVLYFNAWFGSTQVPPTGTASKQPTPTPTPTLEQPPAASSSNESPAPSTPSPTAPTPTPTLTGPLPTPPAVSTASVSPSPTSSPLPPAPTPEPAALIEAARRSAGSLGRPSTEIRVVAGSRPGAYQLFAQGAIFSSSVGTAVLRPPISTSYLQAAGPSGALGWPLASSPLPTNSPSTNPMELQRFQHGAIVRTNDRTRTVAGAIYRAWQRREATNSPLGAPLGNLVKMSAGQYQSFTNGTVYASPADDTHIVTGALLDAYRRHGGPTGTWGWPRTSRRLTAHEVTGSVTAFTGGTAYRSPAGRTFLTGTLLQRYQRQGGPEGRLGWPTQPLRTHRSVATQVFQNGALVARST